MLELVTLWFAFSVSWGRPLPEPAAGLEAARLLEVAPWDGFAVIDLGGGQLVVARVGDDLGGSGWKVAVLRPERLELRPVAPGAEPDERLWLEIGGRQVFVGSRDPGWQPTTAPVWDAAIPAVSDGATLRSDAPPEPPEGRR